MLKNDHFSIKQKKSEICHRSVAYWYISISTLTKMSKNGGYPPYLGENRQFG